MFNGGMTILNYLKEVLLHERCERCFRKKPVEPVMRNSIAGMKGVIYLCDECREKYEWEKLTIMC